MPPPPRRQPNRERNTPSSSTCRPRNVNTDRRCTGVRQIRRSGRRRHPARSYADRAPGRTRGTRPGSPGARFLFDALRWQGSSVGGTSGNGRACDEAGRSVRGGTRWRCGDAQATHSTTRARRRVGIGRGGAAPGGAAGAGRHGVGCRATDRCEGAGRGRAFDERCGAGGGARLRRGRVLHQRRRAVVSSTRYLGDRRGLGGGARRDSALRDPDAGALPGRPRPLQRRGRRGVAQRVGADRGRSRLHVVAFGAVSRRVRLCRGRGAAGRDLRTKRPEGPERRALRGARPPRRLVFLRHLHAGRAGGAGARGARAAWSPDPPDSDSSSPSASRNRRDGW